MHLCYQKAGELCPKGHDIYDGKSGIIAVPARGALMATSRHTIAIECK
jgi:hypothetical protein